MKTPWNPDDSGSALPPPPAPTARDANPWPMRERNVERPRAAARPVARPQPKAPFGKAGSPTSATRAAGTVKPIPQPPSPLPSPPESRPPIDRSRNRPGRGLPLVFILAAMVAAIIAARRAIAHGDFAGAIGPVLVAAVLAFGWWRRSRQP